MRKYVISKVLIVTALAISVAGYGTVSAADNSIINNINRGVTAETGTSTQNSTTAGGAPAPNNSGTYAALGDSVAAGLGLPAVANATAEDMQCGRSSQSCPAIVAQQTGLTLINTSCRGATSGDLFTKQGVSGPNITAQLDTAFAQGTPQLISITAGANDTKWVSFLRTCYASNCANDLTSGLAKAYLTAMSVKLDYALQLINYRSNGNPPTVILTGYYNPLSNYCINRQNYVTKEEIQFLNTQRDALNKTIRDTAARYPFTKYASTNFDGHSLCSSDSWVQNLNDSAPIHPTAIGQQNIAESVLNQVK